MIRDLAETHTGTDNDRNQLNAAISLAKKTEEVLLVAQLDHLSRRASFLNALMKEKGLELEVAKILDADKLN